ncbi:unnamed protein product [Dicrocoelium dendriticum]|nr:unnamed protein product [Dicrocoelium dendriticum]
MAAVFHWSDYLVFAITLFIYSLVGIYQKFRLPILRILRHAIHRSSSAECKEVEEDMKDDLFLGSRQLTLYPVLSSVMASFLSAVSILGTAKEAYLYGIQYFLLTIAHIIGFSISAEVYTPVLYNLKVTSAHEYLEYRFGKSVRLATSFAFVVQMVVYIGVALYTPALAFSQVSGLQIWISILSTGLVATFYTAMGGIRAVVWTDALQLILFTAGLLAIVAVGIVRVGGIATLYDIASQGKRLQSFDFDPNPFKRHTVWTMSIGGAGMILSVYATNQTMVQRYLACKDLKTARLAILLNIPLNGAFLVVQLLCGLTAYVYFVGCDPLTLGDIHAPDQILPYFITVLFDGVPVVRGLFLSVIFAAALSTVSSGINSLAAVVLEDFILPIHECLRSRELNARKKSILGFTLSMFLGLTTIGLSFLFEVMNPGVLQFAQSLFGAVGGPIFAVFTLGLLLPCINWQGALAGLLFSLTAGLWLCIGAIVYPSSGNTLPLSTNSCRIDNETFISAASPAPEQEFNFYSLSYLYYTLVCLAVSVLFSLAVSALFKFNSANPVPNYLLARQACYLYRRSATSFCSKWTEENENSLQGSSDALSNLEVKALEQEFDEVRSYRDSSTDTGGTYG